MKTLRMLMLSMVALVGVGGMASVAHAAPPPGVTVPSETAARPRALSRDERTSLAEREHKSKDLAKYEGGQVVIAISTVGAVVIALILLLILL